MAFRNAWADLTPGRESITSTGRRFVANPSDKQTEMLIFGVQTDRTPEKIVDMQKHILERHIRLGTREKNKPITDVGKAIYPAEADDMLLAFRAASYPNDPHVPFSFTCPSCQQLNEVQVDIHHFNRRLFECGDEACPCHEINKMAADTPLEHWDCLAFEQEHWPEVPENHLQASPPDLVYKPAPNVEIECGFMRFEDSNRMALLATKRPEEQLQFSLEAQVLSIRRQHEDPEMCVHLDRSQRQNMNNELKKWPGWMRTGCNNFVNTKIGGTDQRAVLTCTTPICRVKQKVHVPFSMDFFLPMSREV